jgi:hypothetical protein
MPEPKAITWPADWDTALDTAIRDEGGEWTTVRAGLLTAIDIDGRRVYHPTTREDSRP